jgi:hypothetical protein
MFYCRRIYSPEWQNKFFPSQGIATNRGITIEVLQAKVLANVEAFEAAMGFILGTQQKYEDEIAAATTIEEVQRIIPVFQPPK